MFVPAFASPALLQYPNGVIPNSTNTGNTVPPSNNGAITVTTDRPSYNFGDVITISGSVMYYIDQPVTLIVKSPVGNIVSVDQVPLGSDRTYSTQLTHTDTPLWQASGTYTIVVQFGGNANTAQTTFQFSGSGGTSSPPPYQQYPSQHQIQTTSGGTINVGFTTYPEAPNPGDQTQIKISFINKQTNQIQPHIDYKISIMQDGNAVFGIPMTHTAEGVVSIPFQFQNAGTYQIIVEVDGILFQPIPPETATFSVNVGSGNQPMQPLNPQYTPSQSGISVTTDKTSYNMGDSIVVSGALSQVDSINPQAPVIIQTYDGNDQFVRSDQVIPGYNGQYSITINSNALWQNTGTYTLKVKYDLPNTFSQATFYFNSGITPTPIPSQQPLPATTPTNSPTSTSIPPYTAVKIPNWVKGVFGYYAEGKLADNDLVQGLQFLIQQGIIQIPTVSNTSPTTPTSVTIPNWVKGVFGMYAEGKLADNDLVQGLQFLIQTGIIKLS